MQGALLEWLKEVWVHFELLHWYMVISQQETNWHTSLGVYNCVSPKGLNFFKYLPSLEIIKSSYTDIK